MKKAKIRDATGMGWQISKEQASVVFSLWNQDTYPPHQRVTMHGTLPTTEAPLSIQNFYRGSVTYAQLIN